MRILHLVNDVRDLGNGINNVTVDLACAQADAGHDVHLASAGGEWESVLAGHGVRHHTVPQSRKSRRVVTLPLRLRRLVAEILPDVVHAHNVAGVVFLALSFPRRHWPLVTTIHREEQSARLTRLADAAILLSDDGRRRLVEQGLSAGRTYVLKNGTVGGAREASREPMPPKQLASPSIVTVCGLNPRKGVDDLLRAIVTVHEALPSAHLYVVGDGPQRDELIALCAALRLSSVVTFELFQPRADRWMAACDVFVLASHAEPAGLVLAEARSAGCAVIATAVDGNPNMLDGGAAGLLVPAGRPQDLAAALIRVLTNADERARLRAAAMQGVDDFTVAHMAGDVNEVYVRAVAAKSRT